VLPDLPGATVSSAMKIEADPDYGAPQFDKEVDLVFPKPAGAPDDAVYVVYRRLDGENGRIAYEALDYATVEGDKVVTARIPSAATCRASTGIAPAAWTSAGRWAISSPTTRS
jgi:hypothetical protein